jgi:hypothetical protein
MKCHYGADAKQQLRSSDSRKCTMNNRFILLALKTQLLETWAIGCIPPGVWSTVT